MKKDNDDQRRFNDDDLVLDFATSGTLEDLILASLQSDEGSREHLRARWIEDTIATLRSVRRSMSLTQAELARKMGTHQSNIARLEGEDDITLGKVWDYLFACGEAPAKIEHVSFDVMREFAQSQPEVPETIGAIMRYCRGGQEPGIGLSGRSGPWIPQTQHDDYGRSNTSSKHAFWTTAGPTGNVALPVNASSGPLVGTRSGNSKVA